MSHDNIAWEQSNCNIPQESMQNMLYLCLQLIDIEKEDTQFLQGELHGQMWHYAWRKDQL